MAIAAADESRSRNVSDWSLGWVRAVVFFCRFILLQCFMFWDFQNFEDDVLCCWKGFTFLWHCSFLLETNYSALFAMSRHLNKKETYSSIHTIGTLTGISNDLTAIRVGWCLHAPVPNTLTRTHTHTHKNASPTRKVNNEPNNPKIVSYA